MRYDEQIPSGRQGLKMGMGLFHQEPMGLGPKKGRFIFDLRDAKTGEVLAHWEQDNVITLDAGILFARLSRDSLDPSSAKSNGLNMLGVGTGGTGNLLSPDAPQVTQRRLNNEISRKEFVGTPQYRNADGVAVSYPTNIVDFTTTFGEGEAVGPLNEMGLMNTASLNPEIKNPIDNGPTNYNPAIDVTGYDLMANYLTFSVVSKPSTAVLTITWRLTF